MVKRVLTHKYENVTLTQRAAEILRNESQRLSLKHGRRVTLSETVERLAHGSNQDGN